MSYREKVQWTSLVIGLVVWGVYFARFAMSLSEGHPAPADALSGFIGAVIVLVILQVAAIIAIAIQRPSEAELPADPREREIEGRAAIAGYIVLCVAVCAVMLATPFLTVAGPAALGQQGGMTAAMLVGNALLAALVIASVVHSTWQLALYRRQA